MKARYLRVKDWAKFQHYKDRNPPWIKLYQEVLTDTESAFAYLSEAQQWQLVRIWLLASRCEIKDPDGAPLLAYDETWLRRGIKSLKRVEVETLINAGLLEVVAQEELDEARQASAAASKDASAAASTDASQDARKSPLKESTEGLEDSANAESGVADAPPESTGEVLELKPPAPRKPPGTSSLWDVMVETVGPVGTDSERKRRGQAIRDILTAGDVSEDDVRARTAEYRRRWPNVDLTDTALAKHWTRLAAVTVEALSHQERMGLHFQKLREEGKIA